MHDGPYSQAYLKDVWGNVTRKWGRAGDPDQFVATYTNNRRDGFTYDASGNLTSDGGQTFTYDATGQQASASYTGYTLQQSYDGDRLRVRKTENGVTTYYLRSSALGGQVVAEMSGSGGWQRGYVYGPRGGLLSTRAPGSVTWVYQDPVTKTQRTADSAGNVTAGVDLDPWGRETSRGWNQGQFPRRYTSYERDGNQSDEAMHRRYNRWHLRFDQPDPYDGSYDLGDPQTFNRYSYTNNDPVNFTDPSGLKANCDGVEVTDPATGQATCLGLRDFGAVTVRGGGGVSDGLASLIFGRIALDLFLVQQDRLPEVRKRDWSKYIQPSELPDTPLWCRRDVREAMKRAWARTGNGTKGTEAGFVLNGSRDKYEIKDTKSSNTVGYQDFEVIRGSTFLLFHVHPNWSTRFPSTPENNYLNDPKKGDTLVADRFGALFLVGHRTGLTMYNPETGMVRELRKNLDWMNPC